MTQNLEKQKAIQMFNMDAKEGYKIIDTHSGSASIAIAVDSVNKIEKMNLTLVAGDKDPHYFKESEIRVKDKTSWQSLF